MSDHQRAGSLASTPGVHSRAEILSQPALWQRCVERFQRAEFSSELRPAFAEVTEWLFIGCGSSYYIALAAASTWAMVTGQRARAIPASELLLFPSLSALSEKTAAVLISRSGRTSETVRAAEALAGNKNFQTLAVTCTQNGMLQQVTGNTLAMPLCKEESTVMTSSFTSMLLALQYLSAAWVGDRPLMDSLNHLPAAAEAPLRDVDTRIGKFVEAHDFADYVCLGQGPFYGLACETALKITEMSVSYAQSFHTLEFRHGPKSIVGPETLVVFLLSEQGYDAECDVLEEVKSLGGTTLAITNHADARARASSDLLIELGFDLSELARMTPYLFVGQLLGLYTGLRKGLDPDSPRHLSRVVMLR